MTLSGNAQAISSREELARFIEELAEDLRARPGEWENNDLLSFLGAMSGWIRDMDGYYRNTGKSTSEIPPWQLCAEILLAAKSYE